MIMSDEQFAVVAAKDAEIERLTALMTDREQEILYWMKVAGDNAGISDARLAEVERLEAALRELVDIVQGHLDDGDRLDSFTLQPARAALSQPAATGEGDK